jgi:hypothetical protein
MSYGLAKAYMHLGLAASAPLYTLPSLLNRTSYDRAQPASNLEKFEDANKAAASSLTLAGISGAAFLVAAYSAPARVAYNSNYIGRGASEIGTRFASDRVSVLLPGVLQFLMILAGGLARFEDHDFAWASVDRWTGTGPLDPILDFDCRSNRQGYLEYEGQVAGITIWCVSSSSVRFGRSCFSACA